MAEKATAGDAAGDIETVTKTGAGGTETYLRNRNPRKTVRVTVRSVCHNPRINAVATYDVFPGKERKIATDMPDGPKIVRRVESVAYAPAPGRSKDQ